MRVLVNILFFFVLICSSVFAQQKKSSKPAPEKTKQIEIRHAGVFRYDKGISAKRLIGNVICAHEGAVMNCDSAYLYDSNKLEAFGHISIIKGDSIFVYGDKLYYDGASKLATLEGNVRCIEKDMTLTTPILTFDVKNSIANYYNGGTLVNKDNTLVSKNGHYYSSSKTVAFKYDVELTNPEYKMKGDTLLYNTSNKTSYFLGPSIIISKDDYIYCENGWYDTENEKSQFSKNALLVTKEQKLTGDSLTYDRKLGIGRAFKNIKLIDTTNKSVLYGDYAEYHEKASKALVTKRAMYVRMFDKDSLYLTADTLFHQDIDSVNNLIKAYHKVKFYKNDLQGVCDSLAYSTVDSLMHMFYMPIVWAQKGQATAKFIDVCVGKNGIHSFSLTTNGFVVQQADSLINNAYNQITGKNIVGYFKDDSIRKITVKGNAQILYYPKNKTKLVGLNKSLCSDIIVWFKEGDFDKVSFIKKPESVTTPMKDVNIDEARLKGFNWFESRRPLSKFSLVPDFKN